MRTAEQVSRESGVHVNAVRYRLGLLRKAGKIRFEKAGNMYLYYKSAIKAVLDFGKVVKP